MWTNINVSEKLKLFNLKALIIDFITSGEMVQTEGDRRVSGSVSYVSQQAWIQNMTVQDNILFGKPLNNRKYEEVLTACALRSDLEILPSGLAKNINIKSKQLVKIELYV